MKEIVVLAGLLGVVFMVLWGIITCLEFLIKRKKRGGKTTEARKREDLVPVIVASIEAYEEEERGREKEREKYQRKEERLSWWKVNGRT
jgi:hypothetical protein